MISKFLGGALVIVFIFAWWTNSKYEKLLVDSAAEIQKAVDEVDEAKTANDTLVANNDRLIEEAKTNVENLAKEEKAHAQSRKDRDYANAKYDSYRKRMPEAMAKRGSHMALRSNNATKSLIMRIEATTCTYGCDENRNTENNDPVKPETTGDKPS